jgi:hypothetical protein
MLKMAKSDLPDGHGFLSERRRKLGHVAKRHSAQVLKKATNDFL